MRLKKPKDKDTESKSTVNASVNKIICTSRSHSQTFNGMFCYLPETFQVKFIALPRELVPEDHEYLSGVGYHNYRIKMCSCLGSNPRSLCQKTLRKSIVLLKGNEVAEKSEVIQVSGLTPRQKPGIS